MEAYMKYSADYDKNHPKRYRIATAHLGTELSVIEVGYNKVPPNKKQTFHRDVYILHYVTQGHGVYNDQAFDKNCGYLVVPGEWEHVRATSEEGYEAYWILFRGSTTRDLLHLCGLPHRNCVFPFNKTEECSKIIKEALDHAETENKYEETSLLTAAFFKIMAIHLHGCEQTQDSSPQIAQRMKAYLDENYHASISIEEFAIRSGITRNYLYTLFRKEYGVSPKEYLMDLRIEKAKLLLSDRAQHRTVSDVAYAVGFNDPLYFSKVFKSRTGKSPSSY